MTDELSGVIRRISTAAPVKRQVLSYCLTILHLLNLESILRPWERFINCDLQETIKGKQLTLVNLYAPNVNNDDPTVFLPRSLSV